MAVDDDAVVVDTGGEAAEVEHEGVVALGVEAAVGVDDLAHGVHDEEADVGGGGEREGHGGGAAEGVGVVLTEDELVAVDGGYALDVVDNDDVGGLVVVGVDVGGEVLYAAAAGVVAHGALGDGAVELDEGHSARVEASHDIVGDVVAVDGGAERQGLAHECEVAEVAHTHEDATVGVGVLLDEDAEDLDVDKLAGYDGGGVVGAVVVLDGVHVACHGVVAGLTLRQGDVEEVGGHGEGRQGCGAVEGLHDLGGGVVVVPEADLEVVDAASSAVLDDELEAHVVVVGRVDHHGGGGDIGDGADAIDAQADGVVVEVLVAVALGEGCEVHDTHGSTELGMEGVVERLARDEGMAEELDDIHFLVEAVVADGVAECGGRRR